MQKGPERDFAGYGRDVPNVNWPGEARIALQFVINYEEGSEYSILDGDPRAETSLAEVPGGRTASGERDLAMESMYEYGSRVGVWRLFRIFAQRELPVTIFACAQALERNPEVAKEIVGAGYDICCHGLRWVEHFRMSEAVERAQIREAVQSIARLTGARPLGWYCRYGPGLNTRRLLVEEGGFLYDSDAYNDDLPYWTLVRDRPHLVIPYALDTNDVKFANAGGIGTGDQFFSYLKDSFDLLYREGAKTPKMMSIGLHTRLIGRPGRAAGLQRFLDHAMGHDHVWIARRIDIARHWREQHPFSRDTNTGSTRAPSACQRSNDRQP